MGTNWTNAMFDPPKSLNGAVTITLNEAKDKVAGGHCYVLNGVNMATQYFRLKNSWGRSWADDGHCRISFDAVAYLLGQNGEACVPTDVKE